MADTIIPWIILNCAAKSGSTWLVQMAVNTNTWTRIPDKYQQQRWTNSSVDKNKALDLAIHAKNSNNYFYTKQHWATSLIVDQVSSSLHAMPVVANIFRDPRDMVISRYHHNRSIGQTDLPLSLWLKHESPKVIKDSAIYHKNWTNWGARNSSNYVCTAYEALRSDLCRFGTAFLIEAHLKMGLSISDHHASECARETDFKYRPSNKKGDGKFFRKGVVGGFLSEITIEEEHFILSIANDTGYQEIISKASEAWPWMSDFLGKCLKPSDR